MNPRFRARKRQVEKDAKIDKKNMVGAQTRLNKFLISFFEELPRSEISNWSKMIMIVLASNKFYRKPAITSVELK